MTRRVHKRKRMNRSMFLVGLVSFTVNATSSETPNLLSSVSTRMQSEARPVSPKDLEFLRVNPLRKQKQTVATTGIKTAYDAAVVADAIEGVMRFCISLPYGLDIRSRGRVHVTDDGLKAVQLPPRLAHDPARRAFPQRYSDWHVRSDSEVAVTVLFGGIGAAQVPAPSLATWRMVFLKQQGIWKFDHYDQ